MYRITRSFEKTKAQQSSVSSTYRATVASTLVPYLSSKRFYVLYVGIAKLAHIGYEPGPRHKYAGREPVGFCFLFLNNRFDTPLAHVLFRAALISLMPPDQEMSDFVSDGEASTPTRNFEVVRGMLADYRARLEFDYEDDRRDKEAGRRLQCPLGVLWSVHDDMERLYGDPANPWGDWSDQIVLKQGIISGHHLAEEAPNDVENHIESFFAGRRRAPAYQAFQSRRQMTRRKRCKSLFQHLASRFNLRPREEESDGCNRGRSTGSD